MLCTTVFKKLSTLVPVDEESYNIIKKKIIICGGVLKQTTRANKKRNSNGLCSKKL